MNQYLFIVRNHAGFQLCVVETQDSCGLMQKAHNLIEAYSRLKAESCEIWFRTEHHKMVLLGTAF